MEALPRLAQAAADRIASGALNGRGVANLAAELGVSERHLRRAVERAIGVSPIALAQTHRLLLAKQLLMDTSLSVTQIAFASGFQSLRRFNSVFRERYRLSPTAVRRSAGIRPPKPTELIRLTLAYRAPLAWDTLLGHLSMSALPGVEVVGNGHYARTVRLENRTGVVVVEDGCAEKAHLNIDLSPSLLPALMPLLAKLRRLFDLDAEPTVVDAHLAEGGLGDFVSRRPGLRVPGAFDGFEVALGLMLRTGPEDLARRVIANLGQPFSTETPGLGYLAPCATRVAEAGAARLRALGAPTRLAESIEAMAMAVSENALKLEPGGDASVAKRALMAITGVDEQLATMIIMRALHWPDAFPAADPRAESWRPWRGYAALHLGG